MIKKLNKNEYILLKSKDDLTLEHNKNTPLFKETGFSGTAGEAVKDGKGNITLFVDPRYHIQADSETKGKNIKVVKLDMKTSLLEALKGILKAGDTLFIPSKSTRLSTYEAFKKSLKGIDLKPYETEDEPEIKAEAEIVPAQIAGKTHTEKLQTLKKAVRGQNIFIASTEDVSYLLNLRSYDTPNTSTLKGKMLISGDTVYLFTNAKVPEIKGVKTYPISKTAEILKKSKKEILIDKNTITLYDFNLIKSLTKGPKAVRKNPAAKMASIKNRAEIKHYKEAFKRLDDALYAFRGKIKPGLSELRLKEIFEEELVKNGAKCTSFKTILAVGENSSSIHYSSYSKDKKIKDGEILLIDCGGYYEGGYATDITRVFLCGKAPNDPEIKKIYTAVLKAQLNVYFGEFSDTKSMDDKARKILKPYEKKEQGSFFFSHSLGHGVGIPVHQAPPTLTPNPRYNSKLKNNMVFTIEPGIYSEGKFGIRLENTVYFYKNRNVTLSKFPYEESLIDKNMLSKQEQKWLWAWQKDSLKR